ncbi:MAG TPA: DNA translocase FtsK [Firmicutes bacterium]|jgi:S-DNA-T family DNA segregation ATPase FtsK/SpoIIIE|nr:DNA translocase FtsK [Bacillota bacterium]
MAKKRGTKQLGTENRPENSERRLELKTEILGVVYLGLAVLLFFSLQMKETGSFGEAVRRVLYTVTGKKGSFLLPVLFAALGWQLLKNHRKFSLTYRYVGVITGCLWGILLIHLAVSGVPAELLPFDYQEGGGAVASIILYGLDRIFSFLGTVVVLCLLLLISVILVLDRPLIQFLADLKGKIGRGFFLLIGKKNAATELHYEQASATAEGRTVDHPQPPPVKTKGRRKERSTRQEKTPREAAVLAAAKSGRKLGPYQLPPLDLLHLPARPKRYLKHPDQSAQLAETLASFGVQAQIMEVHQGPVITRYEIHPAPGVKVSRIVNLANDLALALAARGLRIEAPIPGKSAVGIEVPNQEARMVTLREVVESRAFWSAGKLGIAMGVDITGEPSVTNLDKMPHLLIAGATGSGKSVCLNALLVSLLYRASPVEVKLILIDPKRVELSVYEGIPHLAAPVVTETKKAAAVLKAVVAEMEARYKAFAAKGVRDLARYNRVLKPDELPMAYIVVVIDELADLMMVAPVDVEDAICRLAQMARATGIHLVVATQRPSVDVITGLIKANIPSRIAFAVSSQVDSRTILDCAGAEQLLGRGDMLFAPVGALKPLRLQGALVLDEEIKAVTDHWRGQGDPDFVEAFLNPQTGQSPGVMAAEEDELFWDAVKVVVDQGQASASSLQRRFRIGYTRAARLIDIMEEKGFVGPHEGSKPRTVLITRRQLEEMEKKDP